MSNQSKVVRVVVALVWLPAVILVPMQADTFVLGAILAAVITFAAGAAIGRWWAAWVPVAACGVLVAISVVSLLVDPNERTEIHPAGAIAFVIFVGLVAALTMGGGVLFRRALERLRRRPPMAAP